jgi:hypothetical protein
VVEELEARLTPNAYLVNVLGDGSGLTTGAASSDGNPLHGDLRYVLNKAIADRQTDAITFDAAVFNTQQTITLSSSLVTAPSGFTNPYGQTAFIVGVSDNITVDGSLGATTPGITLAGGSATRLFTVAGGGSLTLRNLTLSGGSATGGFGGDNGGGRGGAGGGGAGLGGGVLVDGSTFTAAGCTFVNNRATGGAGGGGGFSLSGGGGGGGLGAPNGGDGAATSANGGMGGGVHGGAGASQALNGGSGGFGGGGGGGGGESTSPFGGGFGGGGGAGGFGGGGGGGGGGHSGGVGGGGGFGGGGGGGGQSITSMGASFNPAVGGPGGFGGGSGGGSGPGPAGGGGGGLGGAVFATSGTLTLTNDTFNLNQAKGGAGGIDSLGGAGQGDGGALFVRNGALTAIFVTFSGNTVTNGDSTAGTGSDLYVLSDASSGTGFGGGTATAQLIDNILGQASAIVPDFVADQIGGAAAPTLTGSHNFVSNNSASAPLDPLPSPAVLNNSSVTDPKFDPKGLQNNHGPTPTLGLLPTSPALGAGVAADYPGTTTLIILDQRGLSRHTVPDLGALESQDPTVTVSSSVNPSVFGQRVTFTALVTGGSPGVGTPTGTVTFTEGTTTLAAAVALTSRQATFSTSALAVGTNTITVNYSGDGDFIASTRTFIETVGKANDHVALNASVQPSVVGQTITLLASAIALTPGAGVPTGSVTFNDVFNGTTKSLGTATLNAFGIARFAVSGLAVGNHTVTASYSGDGNFNAQNSASFTEVVKQSGFIGNLQSSAGASVFGQSITFTASEKLSTGTAASGTVTFQDGATTLGLVTLNSAGQATFSTGSLAVGNHSIFAFYRSTGATIPANTLSFIESVAKAGTSLTLTASPNPAGLHATVTLSATISVRAPGGGQPTGSVTFIDGTKVLGTGTIGAGGVATFTTSSLTPGVHAIRAWYASHASYNGSVSTAILETVKSSAEAALPLMVTGSGRSISGGMQMDECPAAAIDTLFSAVDPSG